MLAHGTNVGQWGEGGNERDATEMTDWSGAGGPRDQTLQQTLETLAKRCLSIWYSLRARSASFA